MKMDYMSSWQSVVAAANNTGAVSLSRPSHYVNVSTSSPTCRSMWWRVLLDVLPKDNTKVRGKRAFNSIKISTV